MAAFLEGIGNTRKKLVKSEALKSSPNLATIKSIKVGKSYEKIKILRELDCEHFGIS